MAQIVFETYGHNYRPIPREVRNAWSAATLSDPHIDDQPIETLDERAICVVVARAGEEMVGFGGLLLAHGPDGQLLEMHDDRLIAELGGTFVHPDWRGRGLGLSLMMERVAYAWTHLASSHIVVCVTTVHTVQHGCEVHVGMSPVTDDRLLKTLCWNCSGKQPGHDCDICPYAPKAAWQLPNPGLSETS